MTRAAWSLIWKWSVPVSRTGPDWTATKIGNALFPGLALPISHIVTLRLTKAPITVCESAQKAGVSSSQENILHLPMKAAEWPHVEACREVPGISGHPTNGFFALFRIPAGGHAGVGTLHGQTRPAVYPAPDGAQVASPAEPYPPLEQTEPKSLRPPNASSADGKSDEVNQN
jgi:hypothetical protein